MQHVTDEATGVWAPSDGVQLHYVEDLWGPEWSDPRDWSEDYVPRYSAAATYDADKGASYADIDGCAPRAMLAVLTAQVEGLREQVRALSEEMRRFRMAAHLMAMDVTRPAPIDPAGEAE